MKSRFCISLAFIAMLVSCSSDPNGDQANSSDQSATELAFADIETQTIEMDHQDHQWTMQIPVTWTEVGPTMYREWLVEPDSQHGVRFLPRMTSLKGNSDLPEDEWIGELVDSRRDYFERGGVDADVSLSTFAGEHHEFRVVTAVGKESGAAIETFAVVDGDYGLLIDWAAEKADYEQFRGEVLAAVSSISWTPPAD